MIRQQFIDLVASNQKALRRFLVALCCGDTDMADDIAQETYLKAYLKFEEIRDVSKFNSWIYKIAFTTFLNFKRGNRIFLGLDEVKEAISKEEADAGYKYQELYLALNCLNESERMAILLYYMEGYSVKEIAIIISQSETAVRKAMSRGRQHLKNLVD